MKHFMLKFNHGVEIGAYLAYIGHASRTNCSWVRAIALDELNHRSELRRILQELGENPNPVIDKCFNMIGNSIMFMCKFCPLWSLNFIARTMEMFAIMNYKKLAISYPKYKSEFISMAKAEMNHELFFKLI